MQARLSSSVQAITTWERYWTMKQFLRGRYPNNHFKKKKKQEKERGRPKRNWLEKSRNN